MKELSKAIVWTVVRLESDDYSAPRGSHGIPEELSNGALHIHWLPPRSGGSLPVSRDDVVAAGELSIGESLWPSEWREP